MRIMCPVCKGYQKRRGSIGPITEIPVAMVHHRKGPKPYVVVSTLALSLVWPSRH